MCLLVPDNAKPFMLCSGEGCLRKKECIRASFADESYFNNEYFEVPPFYLHENGEIDCNHFASAKNIKVEKVN